MQISFENNFDFFPYGTQYYRAPTPLPEEWETDLRELSQRGYTHVQFRPQWRWNERIQNSPEWDDLDTLFDLAEKYNLRVVLKPMLETAPDWVFHDLGGTRIGFHSVPISPIGHGSFYVGGWLPCFDNPAVMEAASKFVREMVARYKDHPSLWFYNAWNEPRSRPLGQCQCEHSIISYQNWLKDKYGTIENLNQYFGKAWSSFDTVNPPQSSLCYAEMYIWRQWAMWAVSRHVKVINDAIKSVHPGSFVMSHIGACSVITDIACDSTDDLLTSQVVDRYGTSWPVNLLPASPVDFFESEYIGDWLRRVDSNFWVHEFYPQMGEWVKAPTSKHLDMLIWMAIASGTSGFTFWQYRSERVGCETNLAGLREIDGSPSSKSIVADNIACILKEHGHKLISSSREKSDRAQLYCLKSDLISRIQTMEACGGIESEQYNVEYPYKIAAKRVNMLYGNGENSLDMVVPGDDLTGVKLLVVSGAEIIEESTVIWLERYVKAGGNLIVEFPFACREDNTWVSPKRPNYALSDLLGCTEKERIISDGEVASFENGMQIASKGWKINLEPTTSTVIAKWTDGSAAAVVNDNHAGKVISLGVSVSLSMGNEFGDPAFDITNYILSLLDVSEPHQPQGLIVRKRTFADGEILFVFNLTDEDRAAELSAEPVCVWSATEFCKFESNRIVLPPHGAWVGEFSGK